MIWKHKSFKNQSKVSRVMVPIKHTVSKFNKVQQQLQYSMNSSSDNEQEKSKSQTMKKRNQKLSQRVPTQKVFKQSKSQSTWPQGGRGLRQTILYHYLMDKDKNGKLNNHLQPINLQQHKVEGECQTWPGRFLAGICTGKLPVTTQAEKQPGSIPC